MSIFDSLVGQAEAVQRLQSAARAAEDVLGGAPIDERAWTHAWLFTGPPGSGRSVAARALAAALQCANGGCGECHACRTVLAGTHPDVKLVVPEGLSIGVDEAREIVQWSARRPSGGRWQVTVVEDADRLTEQAANALLRAIEEPPERGVFLLCAPSAEELLPTIRSRCRLVSLRTPRAEDIASSLVERDGVEPALAAFAARAAQGHVGRARHLALDEESRRQRRDALNFALSLSSVGAAVLAAADLVDAAGDESARVTAPVDAAERDALSRSLGDDGVGRRRRGDDAAVKELERRQRTRSTRVRRDVLDRALLDLAAFYRDVLMLQYAASVGLVHGDRADDVAAMARTSSPESTVQRMNAVLACRDAIEANVAPLLAVEAMALALRTA